VNETQLSGEVEGSGGFETRDSGGAPPVRDLRGLIRLLDDAGKLIRVKHLVDWKFEIGKWTRESRQPLLFENIKDYPGQRVFTNGLSEMALIGLALGFELGTSFETLIRESRKRLNRPIPPKIVPVPPFLENVVAGSGLDLSQFAVPQWSEHDAGRYIGTWHINVTKDPETGQRNVGCYRMQILGPQQATISASAGSDLMLHLAKAEARDQALPVVVAIGVPEVVVIAGGAACPAEMDEFALAGALQQEPVELARSQTIDLEFPANSEIVIEGFIHPGVRVQDGPYFDFCGIPNTNPKAALFEAVRLMSRSKPIFRGSAIGRPGAEDHQLFAFLAQLDLVDFHGSRLKQKLHNFLWKKQHFRAVQRLGKIGPLLHKLH